MPSLFVVIGVATTGALQDWATPNKVFNYLRRGVGSLCAVLQSDPGGQTKFRQMIEVLCVLLHKVYVIFMYLNVNYMVTLTHNLLKIGQKFPNGVVCFI